MTAYLVLRKPCQHGYCYRHVIGTGWGPSYRQEECERGSEERLDPERVLRIIDAVHNEFMMNLPLVWVLDALGATDE